MTADCQMFSNNLNVSLRSLIQSLGRDDVKTVRSLVVQMTNDLSAGLMAEHLISWLPYSKKAGGWVYKSWRDWQAECGISQNVIARVRRAGILESIGFEVARKKANGAPTLHYRLNMSRFVQAVANFLQVSVTYVQQFFEMTVEARKPSATATSSQPTIEQTDADEAAISVSVDSTKSISDDASNEFVENLRTLYVELQKSITEAQANIQTREQSEHNRREAISSYWDKIIATGHLGMSSKQIEEYEAEKAQQVQDEVVVEDSLFHSDPANSDDEPSVNAAADIASELPGLTKIEVKRYIRRHGEAVVRQVVQYAQQQNSLHTPAAWVKSVLRNAVVNLDEYGVTQTDSTNSRGVKGKYADFIDS